MNSLTFDYIKQICTEFVNDSDTTIGMECNWEDYLVKEIPLKFNTIQIMEALGVRTIEYPVPVNVHHDKYGDMDVYIAIYNNHIVISTKSRLL